MSDKYIHLLHILDKAADVQKLRPKEIEFLRMIVTEIQTVIKEKGETHILYTENDFIDMSIKELESNRVVYESVINGGLSVCKICGEFEAGLDKPCTGDIKPPNKEDYVKLKLTPFGWKIYKEVNGFAVSNIDDDGYSTLSLEYFSKLFQGYRVIDICNNELIYFKK